MKLNIGLIGTGRIGKVHAEHLAFRIPEANLMTVADINLKAAEECAKSFGIKEAVEDYHDILDNKDIDAVVICSATDTHTQIISEAAAAGKHIFCEKPIDHNLENIDLALSNVEKTGVKLQVGFNRRFDPNFAAVYRAVREGKIGIPHRLHIIARDSSPPPLDYIKVSGGIFLDMTIHDFDMARFLIGSEVEEVYVAGGVMIDKAIGEAGDLDTALTVLKFKNGVIGTIDNSRKAVYGYDQRVEVFGTKGSISTENNTPYKTVVSDEGGIHTPNPLNFFMERYIESYIREMKEFVKAVLNDTETPVKGIDGRIPVVMGLAARKSYEENRPVKLREIDKDFDKETKEVTPKKEIIQ